MKIQTLKSIYLANYIALYKSDPNVVNSVNSIVDNFHRFAKSRGIQQAIKIHKEAERHVKMQFLNQRSNFEQIV